MEILRPSLHLLSAYIAALEQGWAPDNTRELAAAREELDALREDAASFLAAIDRPQGGVLHKHLIKAAQFGHKPGLRYRIALS